MAPFAAQQILCKFQFNCVFMLDILWSYKILHNIGKGQQIWIYFPAWCCTGSIPPEITYFPFFRLCFTLLMMWCTAECGFGAQQKKRYTKLICFDSFFLFAFFCFLDLCLGKVAFYWSLLKLDVDNICAMLMVANDDCRSWFEGPARGRGELVSIFGRTNLDAKHPFSILWNI